MLKIVFFIPLGEGDSSRVHYTIDSIRRFCNDYRIVVILDGVTSREQLPDGGDIDYHVAQYQSHGHWGAIWINQMSSMVQLMASDEIYDQTVFVKIDADAILVRYGFYKRAHAIFNSRKRVGQIGQAFSDVSGRRLLNLGWQHFSQKTVGLLGLKLFLTAKSSREINGYKQRIEAWLRYRKLVKANPAPYEYSIGGCYCLSYQFLKEFIQSKQLDNPPFMFTPTFGEDAIMGLMVGALGFDIVDDSLDHGLFAVGGIYDRTNQSFRVNPLDIAKRGHIVIHPFKFGYDDQDGKHPEDELVKKFLSLQIMND